MAAITTPTLPLMPNGQPPHYGFRVPVNGSSLHVPVGMQMASKGPKNVSVMDEAMIVFNVANSRRLGVGSLQPVCGLSDPYGAGVKPCSSAMATTPGVMATVDGKAWTNATDRSETQDVTLTYAVLAGADNEAALAAWQPVMPAVFNDALAWRQSSTDHSIFTSAGKAAAKPTGKKLALALAALVGTAVVLG